MPYCTIEEAWGISPNNNSPINPKIATNRVDNMDRASRDYKGLENTNSSSRYYKNKGPLDINLDEQPIAKEPIVKAEPSRELCNYQPPPNAICNAEPDNKEAFTVENNVVLNERMAILLKENRQLKALLMNKQSNNSELIIFCVMGIFMVYIFELFIRFGKK